MIYYDLTVLYPNGRPSRTFRQVHSLEWKENRHCLVFHQGDREVHLFGPFDLIMVTALKETIH